MKERKDSVTNMYEDKHNRMETYEEFVASIERGIDEAKSGKGIPIEEAFKRLREYNRKLMLGIE